MRDTLIAWVVGIAMCVGAVGIGYAFRADNPPACIVGGVLRLCGQ